MRLFVLICFLFYGLISFSQGFVADTAVNKIALDDSVSVLHILGKDSWNFLTESSDDAKTIVYSKNKDEILEMIFHEGNDKYCFSEFKIRQGLKDEKNKLAHLILNEVHFESSKGIKLGLNPGMVEKKLGVKLEQKHGRDGKLILYFRKDITNNRALKRYNMPVFHGEYIFKEGKLIEFTFGFERI